MILTVHRVDIYKDRVPAGWCYALRPSLLEEAIAKKGILLPVALHQNHKSWSHDAPALSCRFYPQGSFMGGEAGKFSVTFCAIPAEQRKLAQSFADGVFLPALMSWMALVEALPKNSTIKREQQEFACEGSPLALNARMLGSIPKGQPRRKRR